MGKVRFIAFEGCDGTGKTTQTELVCQRLSERGTVARKLKFPDYDSPSSGPVRMYLNGELAADADAVNPYAASTLYAVDRFCSFKRDWENDYNGGKLIISDRYVTSNMIFQAAKLPAELRAEYIAWDKDLEYGKLGLPVPDMVLYLNLPVEVSEALVRSRSDRTGQAVDIHEKNLAYQRQVHAAGLEIALSEGWTVIDCSKDGELMPKDVLNAILMSKIDEALK